MLCYLVKLAGSLELDKAHISQSWDENLGLLCTLQQTSGLNILGEYIKHMGMVACITQPGQDGNVAV